MSHLDKTILIVGAGQAGATAAAALRGFGFEGPIVMAGAESLPPYERPPLSKAMLSSADAIGKILVHPAGFYDEKKVELLLDADVVALDTLSREARLANGRVIRYDQCLIATGGRARVVPGLDPAMPRVHYLRSAADALRLREAMQQHRSVLIVGGGFLGLEVASTARGMGLSATVLERASRVLERAVPAEFSQWLQDRMATAGVSLRLGEKCDAFSVDERGVRAVVLDDELLTADLVVVAVGLEPDVALARQAGIATHGTNRGIQVDGRCATSAPGVFAAGDCSSQFHPHAGHELRLESWQSANEQARIAAAAMADVDTTGLAAPWFWTDQFGCNVQMLGMPAEGLAYFRRGVADGGAQAPRFIWLGANSAGQILHAIAVNAGGELRHLKALVDSKAPCDPAALCDIGTPLRQAVRDALQHSRSPFIS